MAQITEFGLERENYTTLLENIKKLFQSEFGVEVALEDSDPLGQMAALIAKLQNDNLNLLEAVWSSRKLSGAEGVYLDDIFGRMGVYRRGKQAGSGTILIEVDDTVNNNYIFPTTTNVEASNGKVYRATQDILLVNSVAAYRLDRADIQLGQLYEFTLTDTTDGVQYPFSFTAVIDADRDLMMNSLSSFWSEHTGNVGLITIQDDTLYIGYDASTLELKGIEEATQYTVSPPLGMKHHSVSVQADEVGYFPLVAGGVSGIAPEFTGFVSVTNPVAFSPGSEVESDAAYRARYFVEILESNSGTRDSVVAAVQSVDGVSKVKIYDNPTSVDRPEADANTFNTVALGGTLTSITEAIYKSKPINTGTSGTSSQGVATADGSSEIIRYTPATIVPLSMRVIYKTGDNVPLSESERNNITQSLVDYLSTVNIGDILYNTRLTFTVLSSSGAGRLISVDVRTKTVPQPASSYSKLDRVSSFNEIYSLEVSAVEYSQVIV